MKVKSKFDNKKIGELVCDGAMKFVQNFAVEINGERVAEYDGLDAVAKDWEDYTPAEPLIKDPKIRKAVRAWAEAIGSTSAFVEQGSFDNEHLELSDVLSGICFATKRPKDIEPGIRYTIEELCGSEEIEILEPTYTTIEEKAKLKEKE